MKKKAAAIVTVIIAIPLIFVINYLWKSLPIITGYSAKQVCSYVFGSNLSENYLQKNDLAFLPIHSNISVNKNDSSVTASVLGFARKKAIYRNHLGSTLINGLKETEVRKQVFNIPQQPDINQDTEPWPIGDRQADTFPASVNKNQLNAAVEKAFQEHDPHLHPNTRAVVVVFNGQIVAEKYAKGFNKDTRFYGWSMAKSFTSALIGKLVMQGKLNVQQPAPVAEWSKITDPRHAITLADLLHQASGLKFEEDYSKSSDATQMLFQQADMAAFTAQHPLENKPGTVFRYSSGNSNILARIVRTAVGEKDYAAFPFTQLFYPLGMYHTFFEPDASGTYVGSSYIMATARDYARFGLLYLNKGMYNGQRILSEDWVNETVKPYNNEGTYGYQFWLNKGHKFAGVPDDMFYCDGFAGQNIFIIPSKKLIVVRLGLTFDHSFAESLFLRQIIKSINSHFQK